MPFKPSPRLRGFTYVGASQYFVTICTASRSRHFTDSAAVSAVLAQLLRTTNEMEFVLIAYCFMPDHLHLLLEGTSDVADFRACLRKFKQRSAFYWKRERRTELWQRNYFEHVLRSDESLLNVARYIVGNPVRAGLVVDPADYPFLGSPLLGIDGLRESIRRA